MYRKFEITSEIEMCLPAADSKKVILGIALLGLLLLSFLSILPALNAYKGSILCPLSKNPVKIDGKWTTSDEWADAFEHRMLFWKGYGECYFRVKHDDSALYILIDFVSDTSPTTKDHVTVAIDADHDGASSPQRDDFRWSLGYPDDPNKLISGYEEGEGENTWTENWQAPPPYLIGAASMDSENNPYSKEAHRIYELSVPLAHLNKKAIGFYVWAADKFGEPEQAGAAWPLSPHDNPSQWTELVFSSRLLSQLKGISNLVYPVQDVELVYQNDAIWNLTRERQIRIVENYVFKPTKVSDSTEIDCKYEATIYSPQGTSLTQIEFYALNGSVVNVEKSAQLTSTVLYENSYVMDKKDVKEVGRDGVYWIRVEWIIGSKKYQWTRYALPSNSPWWSGYTQPSKYIQVWNLDPLKLEEGVDYQFQGQKLKTLAASTRTETGDWVNTYCWLWERETGILLESKYKYDNAKEGWVTTEHTTLKEVKKRDASLSLYVSPSRTTIGDEVKILGAVSVLGATDVQLTIVDPSGGETERTVFTDQSGEYEVPLTPDIVGEWKIQAAWKGTILHNGASGGEVRLSVGPLEEEITTTRLTTTRAEVSKKDLLGPIIMIVLVVGAASIALLLHRRKRK